MDFEDLSQREKEIVLDCMKAILSGKFLWEIEISVRIGIEKHELEDVVRRWPRLSASNLIDALAIHGCMRDARNDISDEKWPQWIRGSDNEVRSIMDKWNSMVDWQELREQETQTISTRL